MCTNPCIHSRGSALCPSQHPTSAPQTVALVSASPASIVKEVITSLTMEAGDADTNATVCGALVGCWLGHKALPREWIQGLVHMNWLENKMEELFQLLDI